MGGISKSIKKNMLKTKALEYDLMKTKAKYLELCKHGITPEMFDQEYNAGRQDGWDAGVKSAYLALYAAMLITMSDRGFGREESVSWLREINDHVCNKVENKEMVEELASKAGIFLDLDDPLEPFKRITDWEGKP